MTSQPVVRVRRLRRADGVTPQALAILWPWTFSVKLMSFLEISVVRAVIATLLRAMRVLRYLAVVGVQIPRMGLV